MFHETNEKWEVSSSPMHLRLLAHVIHPHERRDLASSSGVNKVDDWLFLALFHFPQSTDRQNGCQRFCTAQRNQELCSMK